MYVCGILTVVSWVWFTWLILTGPLLHFLHTYDTGILLRINTWKTKNYICAIPINSKCGHFDMCSLVRDDWNISNISIGPNRHLNAGIWQGHRAGFNKKILLIVRIKISSFSVFYILSGYSSVSGIRYVPYMSMPHAT